MKTKFQFLPHQNGLKSVFRGISLLTILNLTVLFSHGQNCNGPASFIGTHTGTINGNPFGATVSGMMDTSGVVSATLTYSPGSNFQMSGLACSGILCINDRKKTRRHCLGPIKFCEWPDGLSICSIIGGNGTITQTRNITFPAYPGNFLNFTSTYNFTNATVVYNTNWSGTTSSLPSGIIDTLGFMQTLTPMGNGIIGTSGTSYLYLQNGDSILMQTTGAYNLGVGNDLPDTLIAMADISVIPTNDPEVFNIVAPTFGREANCECDQISPIPTLSQWSLIILTILVLALGSAYIIRKRKLKLHA